MGVTLNRRREAAPISGAMQLFRPGAVQATIKDPQGHTSTLDIPKRTFRDDLNRKLRLRRVMQPEKPKKKAAEAGPTVTQRPEDEGPLVGQQKLPQDHPLVNYKYATDPTRSCGTCVNFQAPGACTLVLGLIRPVDVCNLYEEKPQSARQVQAVFADEDEDGEDEP